MAINSRVWVRAGGPRALDEPFTEQAGSGDNHAGRTTGDRVVAAAAAVAPNRYQDDVHGTLTQEVSTAGPRYLVQDVATGAEGT
ncbi:hypothetical protein [Streptomyces sp. SID3343]|uniref:hypothetical protein n=1 Tax=Streptomyces sp. SID3343 TaxID=2690260 RepID=UPI0013712194|nr:hypothetical protein [Streptomyces sp. SID3343]MYV99956.1 hypothetical protein [Streptomyces sp. SID3343]